MENKTYYTVYKVTNKVNGKIYIGCHKTTNLDDGYMGSGKYLKRAIEKHGLEQFDKEILFVYDNPEEMFSKEAELVTEDFIAEENTYNLKVGGMGGFDYLNSSGRNVYGTNGKNWAKYGNPKSLERQKFLRENNPEWVERFKNSVSSGVLNYYKAGGINGFKGKTHNDNTKKIIGENSSKHQSGKNNSQYGTMWIHNEELQRNRKIKKTDPIPIGWKHGKVQNWESFFKRKEEQRQKEIKVEIEKEAQKQYAEKLYNEYVNGDYSSLRDFVNRSNYSKSHVSLYNLWKKYNIGTQ